MFSSLISFTKYFKPKQVSTQDFIFILHSKVTFALLLAASALLSLNQFFGNPIECKSSGDQDKSLHELYCWTHGTYIFNYEFEKKNYVKQNHIVGYGIHPAMHSIHSLRSIDPRSERDGDRIYLRYYQWVVLILVLQAIAFAMPGYLWKIWEANSLQRLCEKFGDESESKKNRRKYFFRYFTSGINYINLCYALKYCFCELLNFLICILNLVMMNIFFMNFWSSYSPALSSIPLYNWNEWNYYSSKVFPKIVKCDIHMFGGSGTVINRDLLCLLPLNILNEKIFAFFFIWFLILTILSGLNIIFRISLIAFKSMRVILLRAQARHLKSNEISNVLSSHNFNYGDWYLLYNICNNTDPLLFKEFWYELKWHKKNSDIKKIDV
ncbi:innexin inx5-like [Condylostylus longicornis]|uniref:innexin inx5-like n=1 Tax=Condylostylus longicornis TaxID=2530218 RepID=UPI00244DF8F7|nr:innexin inx5-like [Condylostylus longicornis]